VPLVIPMGPILLMLWPLRKASTSSWNEKALTPTLNLFRVLGELLLAIFLVDKSVSGSGFWPFGGGSLCVPTQGRYCHFSVYVIFMILKEKTTDQLNVANGWPGSLYIKIMCYDSRYSVIQL